MKSQLACTMIKSWLFSFFAVAFETWSHYVGLVGLDLAVLRLTEILLPLHPKSWDLRSTAPALKGFLGVRLFSGRILLSSLDWPLML